VSKLLATLLMPLISTAVVSGVIALGADCDTAKPSVEGGVTMVGILAFLVKETYLLDK
jgi:hypothetical protein